MPELPEVETTRRGILPHVSGCIVRDVIVRESRLRWPVPADLGVKLGGTAIDTVQRRGKYLLLRTPRGTAIIHLGMSGSLRITEPGMTPKKHDHLDLVLDSGLCLRFHDPRRFGCLLWTEDDPLTHPLLAELGPEPLEPEFTGTTLHAASRGRSVAVKAFLMNSKVVVGVGNIYANESLFMAGISPQRAAGRVSSARYEALVRAIKTVLTASIEQGGTTLRDFVNEAGKPGYFQQTLRVYDRAGENCRQCGVEIRVKRLGQRSTFWCPSCQR